MTSQETLKKRTAGMPHLVQKPSYKGSQRWLQELVNRRADLLDAALLPRLGLSSNDVINWLSPLEADGLSEYRDGAFLELLSIHLEKRSLGSFWPPGGPVWDGLGVTSRGDVILIEAKAHISELASSCQANQRSLESIRDSLAEAAKFYGASPTADWSQTYYQYANRLAHLYLLRQLNGIPAWLVFIYFVNDFEMNGPESVGEWLSAIEDVHTHLGVKREQVEPYVVDIFFDVTVLCGVNKIEKEHIIQQALGTLDKYEVYVVKQHRTGVQKTAAGFARPMKLLKRSLSLRRYVNGSEYSQMGGVNMWNLSKEHLGNILAASDTVVATLVVHCQ